MDAMRKDDGSLSLFRCGSKRSTSMLGMLFEGSLTRKAPNQLMTDVASRSCNNRSLLAGPLAGTFDILFMPFMKEGCGNVSPFMTSGGRSYQGFDMDVCISGRNSSLPASSRFWTRERMVCQVVLHNIWPIGNDERNKK